MSNSNEDQVQNMPPNWWQRASIVEVLVKQFQTHIVGLLLGGSVNGRFQYSLYTGILVKYGDELLWFTAGHVVDNIQTVIKSPNFKPSIMRWLDGYDVPGAESVPLYLQNLTMKSWTSIGLDFGVIKVSILEKENLLANNKISVINATIWKNLSKATPEGYYVIGFPKIWNNFSEKRVEGNKILRSLKADIACLPLLPVDLRVDLKDEIKKNRNSFYARILKYPDNPEFTMENIEGMSGGPILSIERTPESRFAYRLVGIQAGWLPNLEIIRAEPIDCIVSVLDDWL